MVALQVNEFLKLPVAVEACRLTGRLRTYRALWRAWAWATRVATLTEALMDRCLLEEAESSERALAGAKHILFKYSRSQSLYMEIIQKLVAVALVSVVNSDDGLALCLAITILMAAASGMVQPYFHPQAGQTSRDWSKLEASQSRFELLK